MNRKIINDFKGIDDTSLARGLIAAKTPRGIAITSDQMYKIEQNAHDQLGVLRIYMMENAGHGLADFVRNRIRKRARAISRVIAVCGSGNNGGDALVAARHLSADPKYSVSVLLLCSPSDLRTDEAKVNWEIISKMSYVEHSSFHTIVPKIEKKIHRADIIIDGIFGTGIRKNVTEPYASVMRSINQSNAFIVAVDIPSGLDPNTGKMGPNCVKADATVTFHRLKVGLLKKKSQVGRVHVEQIGIPREAEIGVLR